MNALDFSQWSMGINVAIFAVAAGAVWWAGTKLSSHVDVIAERTGLGRAFAGALLLGGATSLPEIATTLTASASGAATLAGTNLLGGVAMQIAVLAAVDALVLRGKALTFFSPRPVLLMQGVMLILMLALAIAAISVGDRILIAQIGAWPVALALAYVGSLWIIYRYEDQGRWEPAGEMGEPPESARDLKDLSDQRFAGVTTQRVMVYFAASALAVLVGGFLVARSGEALAAQTGLGQGIVGATLVALATSLPEVSTTWAAVRFGAYSMAAANILGTNCIEVALFLPADIAYRDGAIINTLDASSVLLAATGIVVTGIYLWGVLERRDRTVLGMGVDSLAVLVAYAAALVLFSRMM